MEELLLSIVDRFWPELKNASELDRSSAALDLFGTLYSLPLALVGLVWLVVISDLSLVRSWGPTLLLLFGCLVLFQGLRFFFFLEASGAGSPHFDSSFGPIVTWSAVLLLGPTALWMALLLDALVFGRRFVQKRAPSERLDTIRNLLHNVAASTLASLVALTLYQHWGGIFPLPGLRAQAVLPAAGATVVHLLLVTLIYGPMLVYVAAAGSAVFGRGSGWSGALVWGITILMAAAALAEFFAILAAGLYVLDGPGVYFTLLGGLLVVSWLAHRLSIFAERSQQRSRELARLERLGRAILTAPPDASTLPDLLAEHVGGMFSRSQLEIRLYPDQTLLHHPADWPPVRAVAWEWLQANPEAGTFLPRSALPWGEQVPHDAGLALVPMFEVEGSGAGPGPPIGGVYLLRRQDPVDIASLLPALRSLAAQVASALHRAAVFRIEQELAVAGRIQASFLPAELPEIPGWQLAATLEPARETSGDFYDIVPLPNGCWGILVADVADKGTGAALYMALSRTLLRTYAVEYETQPELAFRAANRRILADARAELFVTVFYGILDPVSGTLTYCNAGHNPPYLLAVESEGKAQALGRTGLPLGILEDERWEQRTVLIPVGGALVLYTDGMTEAQGPQGEFFGTERLLATVQSQRAASAQEIQHAVISAVHEFVWDAPHGQHDDLTLMILVRGGGEQKGNPVV